jgi:hypothetical protein
MIEIRNDIYDAALSHSQNRIIALVPRTHHIIPTTRFHIPYLSLTQVCKGTRAEFRPLWLKKHVVSLENAYSYLMCFSPSSTAERGEHAIESLTLASVPEVWRIGTKTNIFLLLLQLARRPNLTITIAPGPGLLSLEQNFGSEARAWMAPLTRLLNHRNVLWLDRLNRGYFKEVCGTTYGFRERHCYVSLHLLIYSSMLFTECINAMGQSTWVEEMSVLRKNAMVEWGSEGSYSHSMYWG